MSRTELLRVYGPHLSAAELDHVLDHASDPATPILVKPMWLKQLEGKRRKAAFRASCEAARQLVPYAGFEAVA